MATSNGGLTTTQRRAVEALMVGMDVTSAAKVAGCARQTIHKWMKEDAVFAAELNAQEAELIAHSGRRLMRLQTKAVDFMESALENDSPPWLKIQVARLIIDAMFRLRELKNVEDRLAALEAALLERG